VDSTADEQNDVFFIIVADVRLGNSQSEDGIAWLSFVIVVVY